MSERFKAKRLPIRWIFLVIFALAFWLRFEFCEHPIANPKQPREKAAETLPEKTTP